MGRFAGNRKMCLHVSPEFSLSRGGVGGRGRWCPVYVDEQRFQPNTYLKLTEIRLPLWHVTPTNFYLSLIL